MISACISTARLHLRPLQAGDATAIASLANNWHVARMLSVVPHPYLPSDAETFIASVAERPAERAGSGLATFAIVAASGLIGVIGITLRERGPTLGYWLGEPYWGHGYMSEVALAVVSWYFNQNAQEPLASGAFADNYASLRIQEKLGFETVGFGRQHSRARGRDAPHVDTQLTRARFLSHVKR